MSWTRLDDNYTDHAVWEDISYAAFTLHIAALVYCNRLLTDGHITRKQARRLPLVDPDDVTDAIAELVARGVWLDHGDGALEIAGFLDWHGQRSAASVHAQRAKTTERQRKWVDRKYGTGDTPAAEAPHAPAAEAEEEPPSARKQNCVITTDWDDEDDKETTTGSEGTP